MTLLYTEILRMKSQCRKITFVFCICLSLFLLFLLPLQLKNMHFKNIVNIIIAANENKNCNDYADYETAVFGNSGTKKMLTSDMEIKIIFIDSINGTVTDSVNMLANKAFNDGIDYVLLTSKATFENRKKDVLKEKLVQRLQNHVVSNVGVVVTSPNDTNLFLIIHRSHLKIYGYFFPRNLEFCKALIWIREVYKPFHATELNFDELDKHNYRSIKYEEKRNINSLLLNDRNKITAYINKAAPLSVISYSLYNSNTRYTDGAFANAELVKTLYPTWKMFVFHDVSVPKSVLTALCPQGHVICIDMTSSRLQNKMLWRFLVASFPFISRYIVRDIDSRVSLRERTAVIEWILSSKRFHVMRDHPSHSHHSISGGMWGGTRDAFPEMETILHDRIISANYLQDMTFLDDVVWPKASHSALQHDSFSCEKFGGKPFPTRRIGWEHVGSVYINGKMRKVDVDILKSATPSIQCMCILNRN